MKNHWFLIQQSPQDNAVPHLSDQLNQLYFAEMNGRWSLHDRVLAYIEDSKSLALGKSPKLQLYQPHNTELLLSDLNAVVYQFEDEANNRLAYCPG